MLGEIIEFAIGFGLEAAREGSLKENFIPLAVEIARHQGWVSPHRMSDQVGLSRRDAQIVLFSACSKGLLYRAVNGRFYVVRSRAPSAPTFALEPLPDVQADGDADRSISTSNAGRSGRTGFTVVLLLAAALIAIFLFSGHQTPTRAWEVPTAGLRVPAATPLLGPQVPPWQGSGSQAVQTETSPPPMKIVPVISPPATARAPKKHQHAQQAPKRKAVEPMPGDRYQPPFY